MKVFYYVRRAPFLLMFATVLWSCNRTGETQLKVVPEEGLPVVVDFTRGLAPVQAADLVYDLYVFRTTSGGSDFTLQQTVKPLISGTRLKMPLNEVTSGDYRFLFTAQPTADGQFSVVTLDSGNGPTVGTNWNDIRIMRTGELTLDCYYDVLDMTGPDMIDTERIEGELTRMVGQMVFDFYRTSGGIDDAVSIDLSEANSVLDRVQSIEIVYTGMTDRLAFSQNPSNEFVLVPSGPIDQNASYTQTVTPTLVNCCFADTQTDENIIADHDGIWGKARILGAPLFPSDKNIRVAMDFTYFDTTPICGFEAHTHSEECYKTSWTNCPIPIPAGHVHTDQCYIGDKLRCNFDYEHVHSDDHFQNRNLSLNLPVAGATEGLTVVSNTYTVNKAAIKLNRIIDVPRQGNITVGVLLQ